MRLIKGMSLVQFMEKGDMFDQVLSVSADAAKCVCTYLSTGCDADEASSVFLGCKVSSQLVRIVRNVGRRFIT